MCRFSLCIVLYVCVKVLFFVHSFLFLLSMYQSWYIYQNMYLFTVWNFVCKNCKYIHSLYIIVCKHMSLVLFMFVYLLICAYINVFIYLFILHLDQFLVSVILYSLVFVHKTSNIFFLPCSSSLDTQDIKPLHIS